MLTPSTHNLSLPALHRNDWRHTILLFGLTGLLESLAFGHLSAFTPLFLKQLHVPAGSLPVWTGVLSSLGFVLGLPLLPLWAVWADKYGRKLIIVRSSVAAAVIYALFALSRDVWMLAFARFLGGFVLGNTGVMMAVQADITPREKLGRAVAIISAGAPIGMAVGPWFGGWMIRGYGIRTLFALDALLTGLIALALILFLREEVREPTPAQSTRAGIAAAARAILHSPSVVALFGVTFLLAFGANVAQPYVPLLIAQFRPDAPETVLAPLIGQVQTLFGIAMALSTPFWGGWGDRFGHLRMLRFCTLVITGAFIGQALAGNVETLTLWRCVQGLCQGGIGALGMVLLALYAPPSRRAPILTLSLLPQQMAWFLGPLLGSFFATFSLTLPFWAAAFVLLAGGIASFRLPAPNTAETD